MRAAIEEVEPNHSFSTAAEIRRLRVIVADGSPEYMAVVLALLEFHELVDLIGRAKNFEEAIELVVCHQPDLVLIDLEMPLANLAIPAITLCTRNSVKLVGTCGAETIPVHALDVVTAVNALIHKSRLPQEFMSVVNALYASAAALSPISAPSKVDQNADQQWSGLQFPQTAHYVQRR